ncbi:hypothetical protein JW998_05040 [candidate division KSB1 bacterium]|nr:hypothetical protein [candidate division KSB1 bacterium]
MAILYGSIGRPSKPAEGNLSTADKIKDYLSKVAAHIPSEVISIYLLGKSIAPEEPILGIWAMVCWALAIFLRWWGTEGEGKIINVILTSVAFPIWVMAIGGTLLGFTFGVQISTLIVLVFAVLAGLLYNNE